MTMRPPAHHNQHYVACQGTEVERMVPPTSPGYGYAFPAAQQPYIERVVEGINQCLSAQQLRHNASLLSMMDEELWIPISSVTKLPELDALHMSDLMLPYIAAVLWRYCQDVFEIDMRRGALRPRWALQSSVFISGVHEDASAETVFRLLDGVAPPVGGWGDVRLLKHGDGAWSLLFGRPSCGVYAAMGISGRLVNGGLVQGLACVCIQPRGVRYGGEVGVVEIDPSVYGVPVMPRETVGVYGGGNYGHGQWVS